MNTAIASDKKDRGNLSLMLMKLFDHWQLTTGQQLSLLGLSTDNRSALRRYRKGEALANDRDKLERAGILLGIHKSLRLLFSHNRELAYKWITNPNKAFQGLSPVELIERQGIIGMHMVRAYLDRQRGI